MQDRVDRVTFVAMVLTELLRVDFEKTKRAAWLAKADLTTRRGSASFRAARRDGPLLRAARP